MIEAGLLLFCVLVLILQHASHVQDRREWTAERQEWTQERAALVERIADLGKDTADRLQAHSLSELHAARSPLPPSNMPEEPAPDPDWMEPSFRRPERAEVPEEL